MAENGAKPLLTLELGLPKMEAADTQGTPGTAFPKLFGFFIISRCIFGCIAFAIYNFGNKALYDENIAKLNTPDKSQYGYLYLGAGLWGFLVFFLNLYPAIRWKPMIMPQNAGNLRSNMAIYKVAPSASGEANTQNYIVMEEDGDIGAYNRANRSLSHYVENSSNFIVYVILGGFVYPFPTFVFIALFVLGRIMHQVGYSGGYGGHGAGFLLSMVASTTLEVLVVLAGVKSFVAAQ